MNPKSNMFCVMMLILCVALVVYESCKTYRKRAKGLHLRMKKNTMCTEE